MVVAVGEVLKCKTAPDGDGYITTEWGSVTDDIARTIYTPVSQYANSAAGNTSETSNETRALYLGRVQKTFTIGKIVWRTSTMGTGDNVGEIGLCSGTPVINGNATLTRLGYKSATTAFNSTGVMTTEVTATITRGTHLWLAWWQLWDQGTGATFRSFLQDDIQSGMFVYASATRLSTMASNTAFTLEANNVDGMWSAVGLS